MKHIKKTLALVLALLMAVGMAACAPAEPAVNEPVADEPAAAAPSPSAPEPAEPAADEQKLIGVCMANASDAWTTYLMAAIETYSAEFPGYNFVFQDSGKNDVANQIAQVENMISNGAVAIIMQPANAASSQTITEACNNAGVPLIIVQIKLANQEDATALAASDAYQGGVMQAEYALETVMGGQGKIVVLQGTPGNDNATYRTQATQEVADRNPGLEVVASEIASWDRAQAMTIMENWIQAGLEFDVVMANNDEMAIGASLALQAAGKRDGILIVGFDATSEGLNAVLDGTIDITLQLDAVGQAHAAVDLAMDAINGTLETNEIMVPNTVITIDNVNDFVDDVAAIKE